jgi:hypothetical protein
MITPVTQRWRDRRAYYRMAGITGDAFQSRLHEVAEIPDDTTAEHFIKQHHYAASCPPTVERIGLYRRDELLGIFIGSKGMPGTLPSVFPDKEGRPIECGRFVLKPEVAGNGETWFKARCRELLRRKGYTGLLAFSDDISRTDAQGNKIFSGHLGVIYQASNAIFLGRATPRKLRLLPDGRVFNERTITKIRKGEKGCRPACAVLEAIGAPIAPEDETERREWLRLWLPRLTRPLKHPGNLKYVWPLHPRITINGTAQKYPKIRYEELQPVLF